MGTDVYYFYLSIVLSTTCLLKGSHGQYNGDIRTLDATGLEQSLASPDYDNVVNIYNRAQNCRWLIKADDGFVVYLHFLAVALQRYKLRECYGYITIYDGASPSASSQIAHFCDDSLQTFYSSGQKMYVEYQLQPQYYTRTGFRATFRAVRRSEIPSTPEESFSSRLPVFAVLGIVLGTIMVLFGLACFYNWCRQNVNHQATPTPNSAHLSPSYPDGLSALASNGTATTNPRNESSAANPVSVGTTASAGITNVGFSSLGENPPTYDSVVSSRHREIRGKGFSRQQSLPSYSEAISMDNISPKPQ